MSTPVPPPAPAALAALAVAAGTGGTGTLVRLPPDMAALEAGTLLRGTVLGRAGPGLTIVDTNLGRMTLQSVVAPPGGQPISLQVLVGGPVPQVQFGVMPAAPPPPTQTAGGPAIDISAILGRPLVARVAGPAGTAPPPTAVAAGQNAPAAPASAQSLPAGSSVTIRILGLSAPGTSGPLGGGTLTGTVGSPGPLGETLIQTPAGTLAVALRHPPPPGSVIRLAIDGWSAPQPAATLNLPLSAQWQALADILATLRSADPSAARALTQATPQPGAALTASVLFFLSALSTGDMRRWLGNETFRGIERSAGMDRLRADFGEIRRLSSEPAGQDWRLVLIPLLTDQGLEHLRLFLRDQRGQEGEDTPETGTRFVLEVALSRLGRLQFDGLTERKAIRLILRMETPLPEAMRHDIRGIFVDTLSALGMTGEIAFQVARPFPVNPLQEHAASGIGVTI